MAGASAADRGECGVSDNSLKVRLLKDVREVFKVRGVTVFSSADLVIALGGGPGELEGLVGCVIKDGPWKTCNRGRPLDQNRLAFYLRDYKIEPGSIRFGATVVRGYREEWFKDAWARYLD
jgi:hypothetical protein